MRLPTWGKMEAGLLARQHKSDERWLSMPLTRDQVIETAFGILRDFGLADLSMRRLARDLDVQPGALYWHVKNKQELLGVLSVMILAPATPGPANNARATDAFVTLRRQARAIRQALLKVRDGAEVVALTHSLDPGSLSALRQPAHEFAAAGLPEQQADWAARALVHYILGTVSDEQTRRGLADAGVLAPSLDGADEEAAFDFGLGLLLAGAATSPTPGSQ